MAISKCYNIYISKHIADFCVLPSKTGRCRGRMPRYFYNKNTGKCERFIYGGCRGNNNNFQTRKECRKQCKRQGNFILQYQHQITGLNYKSFRFLGSNVLLLPLGPYYLQVEPLYYNLHKRTRREGGGRSSPQKLKLGKL